MRMFGHNLIVAARVPLVLWRPVLGAAAAAIMFAGGAAAADLAGQTPAAWAPETGPAYDWTGFYGGVHVGQTWGNSNWTVTSGNSVIGSGRFKEESFELTNMFGSVIGGMQGGYNYMLSNRMVIGAEVDTSLSTYVNFNGLIRGGTANLQNGAYSYTHNVFESGTIRGRVGYAPGNWLFYATGGLAWSSDHFSLTNNSTFITDQTSQPRLGWAAGGGIEGPLAPHWTVRAEYLYTGFGDRSVNFDMTGWKLNSNLSEQQVRVGVNYQLNDGGALSEKDAPAKWTLFDPNDIAFHGQFNAVWQGYPAFHSPYELTPNYGGRSLPGGGLARETTQGEFYLGFKLWDGAELWTNPEVDQGYGPGGTVGLANYSTDGAFRVGQGEPYFRLQRFFIRQTIDLGGETVEVPEDFVHFAGTTTSDRLVLTVGRFIPNEMFQTGQYNNPLLGTLNWAFVFPLTWDYGCDAWTSAWGVAAEWYHGRYTFRVLLDDQAPEPDGATCVDCWGLDPRFNKFHLAGEIEERHELWDQPGKVKLLAYIDHGPIGAFTDAIALAQQQSAALGYTVTPDLAQVRHWHTKPGFALTAEQQVMPNVGVFGSAGWMLGNYEVYEAADVQRSLTAGVQFRGELWGRPLDSFGLSAATSYVSQDYLRYLADGGMAVLLGDGQLPHPNWEKVFEAYYTYALSATMNVGLDYQFIVNPGYNTDRGPVNYFAARFHWQF